MEEEAEKAGTEGVAAMERAALNDKLAAKGRRVQDVPANGHCMYLSVVDQLSVTDRMGLLSDAVSKMRVEASDPEKMGDFWDARRITVAMNTFPSFFLS